jgi:hypothetical protein
MTTTTISVPVAECLPGCRNAADNHPKQIFLDGGHECAVLLGTVQGVDNGKVGFPAAPVDVMLTRWTPEDGRSYNPHIELVQPGTLNVWDGALSLAGVAELAALVAPARQALAENAPGGPL